MHPDYQGQDHDVGELLMLWGLAMSEDLGVPIYLETTTESTALYERSGFHKLEGITIAPPVTHLEEGAEVLVMVRMPDSAGDMTFEEWAVP